MGLDMYMWRFEMDEDVSLVETLDEDDRTMRGEHAYWRKWYPFHDYILTNFSLEVANGNGNGNQEYIDLSVANLQATMHALERGRIKPFEWVPQEEVMTLLGQAVLYLHTTPKGKRRHIIYWGWW